jgi:hypothetical protein
VKSHETISKDDSRDASGTHAVLPSPPDPRHSTLERFLREPLTHFVLLGALLFGVYALVGDWRRGPSDQIVVSRGQIEQLVVGFTRTWRRPPTQEELKGLIDDHIREEILYRQAVAMGLDRDDLIVRRRMRQKLEFLTEDLASQAGSPSDEDLQAYLDQHADAYREEPRFSFEHIYFNSDRRRKSAKADATAALAQLNGKNGAAQDLDSLGDATLLPTEFSLATKGEIARMFGEAFTRQLLEVKTGRWSGPIESSFGLHVVRVVERTPGNIPELAKVRDAVIRDLLVARRRQALEVAYANLRQRYTVTIEQTSQSPTVEASQSQRVAAR